MSQYDPYIPPIPHQWLALGESERMLLVEDYHRRARIEVADAPLHASVHAIVENQAALGDDTPVQRTLVRLMAEGLDRHDAIHAIGSTLMQCMKDALRAQDEGHGPARDLKQDYFTALNRLSTAEWLASDGQSSETEEMDVAAIVAELARHDDMPVDAIRAARAQRTIVVPAFLVIIERYLEGAATPVETDALFLIFHLLGEWREKSAYPLLARLLRRPEIGDILGDATIETCHRVMVAVFEGDPQPLYDIVLDKAADQYLRSRIFETIAILTLRNELRRAETVSFLTACYSELEARDYDGNFVWVGWVTAIYMLGLSELKGLVEQAFARGLIDTMVMTSQRFEQELQQGIEHPGEPSLPIENWEPYGDTIAELSSWSAVASDSERDWDGGSDDDADYDHEPVILSEGDLWYRPSSPVKNPLRDIGRNDPCPCGSGKKFKKCCLEKKAAA